jgi:hypothetical protein
VLFACRCFRYTRVHHHAKIDDAAPSLLVGRTAEAEILPRHRERCGEADLPIGILSASIVDLGRLIRDQAANRCDRSLRHALGYWLRDHVPKTAFVAAKTPRELRYGLISHS